MAVPEIRRLFTDRTVDPVTRAHLGVALAKHGVQDAVADLLQALGDPARIVRSSAAIGLGIIGDPGDRDVVTALRQVASRPSDPGTRNFALISLGRLASGEAVAFLLERLRGSRGTEKAFVALALGLADRGRKEEDDAGLGGILLREFEQARSPDLQGALAVALGLAGRRASIGPLDRALARTADADLKGHLATALGLIGARSAGESIRAIAAEPRDPETLRRVALALGRLRDQQALAAFERLTRSGPGTARLVGPATIALGLLGDRRALPGLVERLGDRDAGRQSRLRACAATAVGCLADKDAVPALARLSEHANYLADTPLLRDLIGHY
jgi:HEAT repeat protein